MLDFCLLIWHHECLCSSFAWFETETGKTFCTRRPVTFWRGGNNSGHNTFTANLLNDMRGSAGKSLRANFCARWSWVITHPDHFTSWNRAPPLLPLIALDEVFVRPGRFWQKENLFAIPSKELRLVKTLAGFLEWRIFFYCKPLSPQRHTKLQALGEIRCGRCRIQVLRSRYVLC